MTLKDIKIGRAYFSTENEMEQFWVVRSIDKKKKVAEIVAYTLDPREDSKRKNVAAGTVFIMHEIDLPYLTDNFFKSMYYKIHSS